MGFIYKKKSRIFQNEKFGIFYATQSILTPHQINYSLIRSSFFTGGGVGRNGSLCCN